MLLISRQIFEGVRHIRRSECTRFFNRQSGDQPGQHRCRGDRRRTTLGLETRRRDLSLFNSQIKMEQIAADGIARFAARLSVFHHADVARIVEVCEDGRTVHR